MCVSHGQVWVWSSYPQNLLFPECLNESQRLIRGVQIVRSVEEWDASCLGPRHDGIGCLFSKQLREIVHVKKAWATDAGPTRTLQ